MSVKDRDPSKYPCSEWGHIWDNAMVGNKRVIKRCSECGEERKLTDGPERLPAVPAVPTVPEPYIPWRPVPEPYIPWRQPYDEPYKWPQSPWDVRPWWRDDYIVWTTNNSGTEYTLYEVDVDDLSRLM